MSEYLIRHDKRTNRWSVFLTGEFARYVTSFDRLWKAENYVLAQTCPDEVES